MINGHVSAPPPPAHYHFQAAANIYPAAYPGSMQSWMSATQEFFCSESMVSRMYSPPFSTCRSSQALRSHTRALHKGSCEGIRGGPYWLTNAVLYTTLCPKPSRVRSRNGRLDEVPYLEYKSVVLVGHLQRHGGPHLHDG